MAHSNLSADLVVPQMYMYALRVVQQTEKKLDVVLDTAKHWINSGDSSCNCYLCPSSPGDIVISVSLPGSTNQCSGLRSRLGSAGKARPFFFSAIDFLAQVHKV